MCKLNIAAYDKGIMPHGRRLVAATNNSVYVKEWLVTAIGAVIIVNAPSKESS